MVLFLLGACSTNYWDQGLDPVYGIANIDDDDSNGTKDWDDGLIPEEDDLSSLVLPESLFSKVKNNHTIKLYQNDDGARIYFDEDLKTNSADDYFSISPEKEDITLEVEFKNINTTTSITIVWEDDSGNIKGQLDMDLISVPMLLNHHLQPMEQVYAMEGTGFVNNQDFIKGFEDALGSNFTAYPLRDYEWDVWLQDEVEFATLSSENGRTDIIVDSIRNRGLDDLPEDYWEEPGTAIMTWGTSVPTSQDSFGNLETTPPVDGYPYGRIYYGDWYYGNSIETITEPLVEQLTNQDIQKPFTLDVTFLCVGHVDEYFTFVPDASSEKGFKMMLADVDAGYEFLNSLDPNLSLPKYASDHGFSNVGEILEDNALTRLNEDIQLDYLDVTWARIQEELGLTEEDLIRVPMLFEEAAQCGGYTATLIPSTLNMVVATGEDGTSADLIIPDPYFRSSTTDPTSDVFIQHVNDLLPDGNTPHWVDDWAEYHMMLGEVHCGSNTKRTPMLPYSSEEK